MSQEAIESIEVSETEAVIAKLKEYLESKRTNIAVAKNVGINKNIAVLKSGREFIYLINPKIIDQKDKLYDIKKDPFNEYGHANPFIYKEFVISNNVIDSQVPGFLREEMQYFYYDGEISSFESVLVQTCFNIFDGKIDISKKHEAKDISRNDPCPCGSGKKYKKCCINLGK